MRSFSAARNEVLKIGRVSGGGTETVLTLTLTGNPVCADGEAGVRAALERAGLLLPNLETLTCC